MTGRLTRRAMIGAVGGAAAGAFAPAGLRLSTLNKRDLWHRTTGPHLRGAVFVQRRVYAQLDGSTFLGRGPFGPPITDQALDHLAEAGANLASWSGPGLFGEAEPFGLDPAVEDHIGQWLERCRARGLFTTLCFRSGPGRSAFAFHPEESWYPAELYDDSVWRDRSKQIAWAEMIAQTLIRFGDHPALAGIVPMEEPNGADLGFAEVWPSLASTIAQRIQSAPSPTNTPLLFSPDRWARGEAVEPLRAAIGDTHPVVLHDYEPWRFTHQSEDDPVRYDRQAMSQTGLEDLAGDWSVLEFGAVRHAPGVAHYLRDRIRVWEASGANWAAFRWSSGWASYESTEASMTLNADSRLLPILRQAFAKNRIHPN